VSNAPARIDVPEGRHVPPVNESKTRAKRGRPVGARDSTTCRRQNKGQKTNGVVCVQHEETRGVVVRYDGTPPT
jgi:hypothetical protein